MLAHSLDVVIGVDSHRDTHALALVAAATGVLLAETRIEASASGYARALSLARTQAPGRRFWAIEGTGCYGAGLARYLCGRGGAAHADAGEAGALNHRLRALARRARTLDQEARLLERDIETLVQGSRQRCLPSPESDR